MELERQGCLPGREGLAKHTIKLHHGKWRTQHFFFFEPDSYKDLKVNISLPLLLQIGPFFFLNVSHKPPGVMRLKY